MNEDQFTRFLNEMNATMMAGFSVLRDAMPQSLVQITTVENDEMLRATLKRALSELDAVAVLADEVIIAYNGTDVTDCHQIISVQIGDLDADLMSWRNSKHE